MITTQSVHATISSLLGEHGASRVIELRACPRPEGVDAFIAGTEQLMGHVMVTAGWVHCRVRNDDSHLLERVSYGRAVPRAADYSVERALEIYVEQLVEACCVK